MIRIRPGVAALAGVVLLGLAVPPAFAASTGGSRGDKGDKESAGEKGADEADQIYERGLALAKEEKFEDARGRFEQANKKRKNDPEILNMLAYCQRKTGDLDAAFANYRKALELRPEFPQAREYLGEAHLQAALLQLEILRGYGPEGAAESSLLAAALRTAVAALDGATPEPARAEASGGRW